MIRRLEPFLGAGCCASSSRIRWRYAGSEEGAACVRTWHAHRRRSFDEASRGLLLWPLLGGPGGAGTRQFPVRPSAAEGWCRGKHVFAREHEVHRGDDVGSMRTRTAAEVAAQSAGDGGESASQRPGARAIPFFKRATSWISDLLRDFQGAKRRGARASLLLVGDGEAKQQPAAELVVVHLVGLDGLAVEPRRGGVPPWLRRSR